MANDLVNQFKEKVIEDLTALQNAAKETYSKAFYFFSKNDADKQLSDKIFQNDFAQAVKQQEMKNYFNKIVGQINESGSKMNIETLLSLRSIMKNGIDLDMPPETKSALNNALQNVNSALDSQSKLKTEADAKARQDEEARAKAEAVRAKAEAEKVKAEAEKAKIQAEAKVRAVEEERAAEHASDTLHTPQNEGEEKNAHLDRMIDQLKEDTKIESNDELKDYLKNKIDLSKKENRDAANEIIKRLDERKEQGLDKKEDKSFRPKSR